MPVRPKRAPMASPVPSRRVRPRRSGRAASLAKPVSPRRKNQSQPGRMQMVCHRRPRTVAAFATASAGRATSPKLPDPRGRPQPRALKAARANRNSASGVASPGRKSRQKAKPRPSQRPSLVTKPSRRRPRKSPMQASPIPPSPIPPSQTRLNPILPRLTLPRLTLPRLILPRLTLPRPNRRRIAATDKPRPCGLTRCPL